jgi:hypothetical protein
VFLTEFGLEMILEDQIDALGFQHADAPESAGGGRHPAKARRRKSVFMGW